MAARSRRRDSTPQGSPAEVREFLRNIKKPFRSLGFFVPGIRSSIIRELGRAEEMIEEAEFTQQTLDQIVKASQQLREEISASNQAFEKMARVLENRGVQDQIFHEKLDGHLDKLARVTEGNLRLTEREDAVKQREIFARETATRLTAQMEESGRLQDEAQKTLKEANTLYSGAQALQEESQRKQRTVDEESEEVAARKERLEAFKLQLQAREQTLHKEADRISSLQSQRESLEGELKSLKEACASQVARGEEIVRERELALVQREQEAGSASLLTAERNRALQEREYELDDREEQLRQREAQLEELEAQNQGKQRQIEGLTSTIQALTEQRDELNRMLAALSAKL